MLRTGDRPEFIEELMERVRVPVLVIHGERDRLVNVALARRAAGGRRNWRLEVFDGVGHAAQMEVPGRWVEAVEHWLATTGIAQPDRAGAI